MKVFAKIQRLGIILATFILGVSLSVAFFIGVRQINANAADGVGDGTVAHECSIFGDGNGETSLNAGVVNQQMFDELLIALEQSKEVGFETPVALRYALAEDVSCAETIEIPENLFIGVCLNGYTLQGNVVLPETDNAGFFVYDCTETHTCPSLHGTLKVLSQDLVDFLPYWGYCNGTLNLSDNMFALSSDVTFGDLCQGAFAGGELFICRNGHNMAREEILGADIMQVDCLADGMNHACSALGDGLVAVGLSEVPMTEDNTIVEEFQNGSEGIKLVYTKATDSFTPYVDENGYFFGSGSKETPSYGTYAFSLREDISLAKTLKIPAGMDVHICLNGHKLRCPEIRIYLDDSKEDILNGFMVEEGASLTICDCSPNGAGMILSNLENYAAESGGDLGTALGAALGVVLAHTIANEGTVTINGGRIVSSVGIVNQGDLVVNGGEVAGALTSVMQGVNMNATEVSEDASLTFNGGILTGGAVGVYGASGEITVNDGVIQSYMSGVLMGSDLNGEPIDADALLNINGGSIVFDDAIVDVFIESGMVDVLDVNMDELLPTDATAMMTSGTVNMNADIDIIYTDSFLAAQQKSAELDTAKRQEEADKKLGEGEESIPVEPTQYGTVDIVLNEGALIEVVEGQTYENKYEIVGTGSPSISAAEQEEMFVPADGFVLVPNEVGGLVIVETTEANAPMKVAGATASTDGTIKMNFYVTLEDAASQYSSLSIVLKHDGRSTKYAFSDGVQKDGYYVFSIGVAAKDYKSAIECTIVAGDSTGCFYAWKVADVTLLDYLEGILADNTGAYDDNVKLLCLAMKNYCAAASVSFGIATGYTCPIELQEYMDMVTSENLLGTAMSYSGTSDYVTLRGTTLLLESTTAIRIYFSLKEGKNIDEISCTVDGETVMPILASGTSKMYYVEIANIAAVDLDEFHGIVIDGYTVNYCALSYAYAVLVSSLSDENSITTVKALCIYYMTAEMYFSSRTEE